MNAVNIKTVGGCVTRLTVNVTAPEGVTTALTGFVRVQGVPQPAQVIEPGVLLLPAAEPGEYLYEVRAGGRVAAFGHLLVRQSAYPATGDTIDVQIDADLTQSGGIFAVTLTEGARGPQGEQGEQGPQGERGEQGERAALGAGDTRTLKDWGLYTVELTAAETDLTGLSVAPTATARLLLYPQAEGCTAVFPLAWVFLTPLPQVAEPNTLYCVTVFADAHGNTVANFAFNAAAAVA